MKVTGSLDYTQKTQIGATLGLNSKVFLIDEPQLGGEMVVKEIDKHTIPNPTLYFAEAQRVFASGHPNVVPIQYACETPGKVCLVMPFFSRGPLTNRIATGPLREREVLRIGIAVLAGLSHIHAQKLVHFDVKPSNVLFSDADEPMVSDFGQATPVTSLGTTRAPPLYPNAYPPEVYQTGTGSPQTDIYHVGLLLYRAANGEPHYKRQVPPTDIEHEIKTLKGTFPDRKAFLPHVGGRLRTIIRKALRVDPTQRYQTAAEMATDLGRVSISVDWDIAIDPKGTSWSALRSGSPKLVVRMERETTGTTFSVDVFTQRASKRRAKEPGTFRKTGASEAEALKHLNDVVFPALP